VKLISYQWLETTIDHSGYDLVDDSLVSRKIRQSANLVFKEKGYSEVPAKAPDFYVAYLAGLKAKVNVNEFGYSYGQWYGGVYGRNVNVDGYQEGILILDIIRARDKELIWRGWATGVIENPKEAGKKIDAAVRKILNQFPPKN
jgi:hypothetical protein